jgi:single-strand DNA-binding protein
MIKMQVIGVIGQDATINNVNSKTVVNFSVAHSEKYKDQNGQVVNKTVWVNVSYWVDRTTIAQYLKKSTNVYLEGIPSVDVYKNKDGQTVPQLRLRATMVQLLGGNKQDNPQAQVAAQPTSGLTPSQEEFLSDEAPFNFKDILIN